MLHLYVARNLIFKKVIDPAKVVPKVFQSFGTTLAGHPYVFKKGQLISEGKFGVFKSPEK